MNAPAKKINLATIRIDGGTQMRVEIDEETVARYVGVLEEENAEFTPIVVFNDGTDMWLADGFHRYHAYTRKGRASIPADVRTGTLRDAKLYAMGANKMHGKPPTNADKRKAVGVALDDAEWSKLSARDISKLCGCTHWLVNTMIAERSAPPAPPPTDPKVEGPSTPQAPKTPKGGTPAEPPSPPAGPTKDEIGEAAHGTVTVGQLLDETQAELDAAIKKIAALEADDKVKELSKWQTAADVHSRRADEHLAKVNLRDKELTRLNSILKKISEIVGEEDYSKLPSTIKAFADAAAAVA